MAKRIIRTSVAIMLVFAVLLNVSVPAIEIYARADINSKGIVLAQMDSWNKTLLSTAANENTLPTCVSGGTILRQPKIGEPVDASFNLFNWIAELFSKATYAKSSNSDVSAVIYENITDDGIKVSAGSEWISIIPSDGDFSAPAATDCAVRFTNVFDDVDYQFATIDGKVQVDVLYEGANEINSFEFDIDRSKGLNVEQHDSGLVISKNSTPLFAVSAPIAKDIGGSICEAAFSVSENGKLIITVDEAWLQDLSRAYPISVGFSINKYTYEEPVVIKSEKALAASFASASDFEIEITPNTYSMGSGLVFAGKATISGIPEGSNVTITAGNYSGEGNVIPFQLLVQAR